MWELYVRKQDFVQSIYLRDLNKNLVFEKIFGIKKPVRI